MTENRIEPDDEDLLDSALSAGHKSSHHSDSRHATGTRSAPRPGTGEDQSSADAVFRLPAVRLRAVQDAEVEAVPADILPGFDARYDIRGEIGKALKFS